MLSTFFSAAARRRFSSSTSLTVGLQNPRCPSRAFDPRPNLGKRRLPVRGRVIGERRETAIVGCTELLEGNEAGRFEHPVVNFFRRLDSWIDRIDHADKYALV